MVLQERIELSTSPLPRECSTTELLQRRGQVWFRLTWRAIRRKRKVAQDPTRRKVWGSFANAVLAGGRQGYRPWSAGGHGDVWTPQATCAKQARMSDDAAPSPEKPAKSQRVQHREARLKSALKANMAKRKAQVRAKAQADDSNDKE